MVCPAKSQGLREPCHSFSDYDKIILSEILYTHNILIIVKHKYISLYCLYLQQINIPEQEMLLHFIDSFVINK